MIRALRSKPWLPFRRAVNSPINALLFKHRTRIQAAQHPITPLLHYSITPILQFSITPTLPPAAYFFITRK